MDTEDSRNLLALDQFDRALAEAETFDEVQTIRSKADVVRHLAKSAKMSLEVQNRAAEVKLRAERKAGVYLAQLKLRGGDRKSSCRQERLTLSDLGITPNESKRWQREASIPEEDFQRYVRRANEFGEELSAAGLMRLAGQARTGRAGRSPLVATGGHNGHWTGGPRGSCASAEAAGDCQCEACAGEVAEEQSSSASSEDRARLLSELLSHHALVCQMLAPLCHGEQESWLPGQRRGTWHYLSEIGRLLMQLAPLDPSDAE